MPLDRHHITVPSQIMLPTYVIFFAVVGGSFIFSTSERLLNSPMLRYADHLMPIKVWGVFFVMCSVLMLAAMFTRSRFWFRYGLMLCCGSMLLWTLVAIGGMWAQPPVTFSAWAWPAAIAAACWASNKSLEISHGPTEHRS